MSRRAPRGDRLRTSALLWGGWLLVTAAVLSFGQGIIHPYYTVAPAPAIGALVGVGALELWRRRATTAARVLPARTPDFAPWLRVSVLIVGLTRYIWVAAAIGSNTAAGYQLATGDPVMPVGGFNGTDPSPTLEQFQRYVTHGKIHYFIGGGGFGRQNGGADTSRQIAAWVAQHVTARTIDGVTLYDLTVVTP